MALFGLLESVAVLFALLAFVGFALTVAAAIHILVREGLTGVQRLVWLLIVVFVPFAALVYFLLGRERTARLFRDLGMPST